MAFKKKWGYYPLEGDNKELDEKTSKKARKGHLFSIMFLARRGGAHDGGKKAYYNHKRKHGAQDDPDYDI
ncbi:MAG: hypothetical protein GY943_36810 [Chloroflexi bacterium]|nr:hypothetical protein [Chloroflexota bacterium]